MAKMIKCKGCGEQISKNAKSCPKCGEPAPKKTSLFAWIFLIGFGAFMVNFNNALSSNKEHQTTNVQKQTVDLFKKKRNQVAKLFKSNKEPVAKDAIWTSNKIFKVGVINDGTSRDGYAQYVCLTLNDYGFKNENIWVQIIDINKLTKDGKWIKIGEAHCK